MELHNTVIQIFVIIVVPALLMLGENRVPWIKKIGAVVIAYAAGILLGVLPWPNFQSEVANSAVSFSIPFAIIFLLFMTAFKTWLMQAKQFVIAFLLGVVAVSCAVTIGALIWQDTLDEVWKLAGMVTGVYTGGTPNMSVIGRALDVPDETFIALNATDLMLGAIYLLFLFSFAKPLFGYFLKENHVQDIKNTNVPGKTSRHLTLKDWLIAGGVVPASVLILLASVQVSEWYHGEVRVPLVFLVISTGAIAFSFIRYFRENPINKPAGEYFLLIFCFSIGLITDPNQLYEAGRNLLGFVSVIFLLSIFFHFLLAKLFDIERDVFILTSTACLYGPPFIPAVCKSLKRDDLIVSGVTTALIGFAIANFLGIGIAYGLEWYLLEGVKVLPGK